MDKINNTCEHKNVRMSEKYDATYCADCREWLEGKCPDEELCNFCESRPDLAPPDLEQIEEKLKQNFFERNSI